jgi:lactobin A/cerein 7B family class IIb bacteriocin
MQELTQAEIDQVHGGVGPVGAAIGAVIGGVGAAAATAITGGNPGAVITAGLCGAATGAVAGASGIGAISLAVRVLHQGVIGAGLTAGGGWAYDQLSKPVQSK